MRNLTTQLHILLQLKKMKSSSTSRGLQTQLEENDASCVSTTANAYSNICLCIHAPNLAHRPPTTEEEEQLIKKMKTSLQSKVVRPYSNSNQTVSKTSSATYYKHMCRIIVVNPETTRCGQCHRCTLPYCAQCSCCKDMRNLGGPAWP